MNKQINKKTEHSKIQLLYWRRTMTYKRSQLTNSYPSLKRGAKMTAFKLRGEDEKYASVD